MSSIPCRCLCPEFAREMYVQALTLEDVDRVLACWEPYRDRIEHNLDGYEEDEQSWRDYRNAVFDWLPDPLSYGGPLMKVSTKEEVIATWKSQVGYKLSEVVAHIEKDLVDKIGRAGGGQVTIEWDGVLVMAVKEEIEKLYKAAGWSICIADAMHHAQDGRPERMVTNITLR